MEGSGRALVDGQNLAFGPRVQCVTAAGGNQRNVRAHGRALDPRHVAQCGQSLFRETFSRSVVGIARLRQSHEADPEIVGAIADALLA